MDVRYKLLGLSEIVCKEERDRKKENESLYEKERYGERERHTHKERETERGERASVCVCVWVCVCVCVCVCLFVCVCVWLNEWDGIVGSEKNEREVRQTFKKKQKVVFLPSTSLKLIQSLECCFFSKPKMFSNCFFALKIDILFVMILLFFSLGLTKLTLFQNGSSWGNQERNLVLKKFKLTLDHNN